VRRSMSEPAAVPGPVVLPRAPTMPFRAPTSHGHAHGSDNRYLMKLAFGALGVVYGDIGTSPLYSVRECFVAAWRPAAGTSSACCP